MIVGMVGLVVFEHVDNAYYWRSRCTHLCLRNCGEDYNKEQYLPLDDGSRVILPVGDAWVTVGYGNSSCG